jgi:dolichol-phosphate mannosyltransferase
MAEIVRNSTPGVGVVIPCFRASESIRDVVLRIPLDVQRIVVVDDADPDRSYDQISDLVSMDSNARPIITVIHRTTNGGVGQATVDGLSYLASFPDIDVLIKLDADGQMSPEAVPLLVQQLIDSDADYAKGNRLWSSRSIREMPRLRIFLNAITSFASKFSSGYWQVLDPANGFFAIRASVFKSIESSQLDPRWFFESDILFQLSLIRALVVDVPMRALYSKERSNVKIIREIPRFASKHLNRFFKRLWFVYFLRSFSIASLFLIFGIVTITLGLVLGTYSWSHSVLTGRQTLAGTIGLVSILLISGALSSITFILIDMQNAPSRSVHKTLSLYLQGSYTKRDKEDENRTP